MLRRIHVIGRKNSGKTTLIVDLVRHLTSRGLRVGTIKHTHHRHELDVPGKDSFRHREAGAAAVGILSPAMNAVFWPTGTDGTAPRRERYDAFESLLADCDMVLVEGDSQTDAPKVEVWRAELAQPPLAADDASILALITDAPVTWPVEVWPRGDLAVVADRMLDVVRRGHRQSGSPSPP